MTSMFSGTLVISCLKEQLSLSKIMRCYIEDHVTSSSFLPQRDAISAWCLSSENAWMESSRPQKTFHSFSQLINKQVATQLYYVVH